MNVVHIKLMKNFSDWKLQYILRMLKKTIIIRKKMRKWEKWIFVVSFLCDKFTLKNFSCYTIDWIIFIPILDIKENMETLKEVTCKTYKLKKNNSTWRNL